MQGMMSIVQRMLGWTTSELESHRRLTQIALALAGLAMVLRLVFWVYAQRYWDDALIACLHSENAAMGLGLTHGSSGAPVHGFTSPLGVLIPLLGDLIHVGWGIELLKLVSLPAAGLGVLMVLGVGTHPKIRLAPPLVVLAMGYVAVEHHQILWGMAGLETQLSVLGLLATLYFTISLRAVPLGLALGSCMLVRPDFAFLTIIVGAYVLLQSPRDFLRVAGVALALYLPWVAFTTLYYGSPIPHTVIAKGISFGWPWRSEDPVTFFTLKRHIWVTLSEHLHIHLGPAFGGHGAGIHKFFTSGPESPIANGMFFLAVLGALVALVRRQWALWPLVAFAVVYGIYFVFFVPVLYGWYKVPYTVGLLLLALWGMDQLTTRIPKPAWRTGVQAAFATVYLGLFLVVLPQCFYAERMIQRHVDNDVRRAAGAYLQEHMEPDDVVATEALGYIAYYSRRPVYDWPGLASSEVVAWSKHQAPEGRTLENMCRALKPEFLFLRDLEVLYNFESSDWLEEEYHAVARFEIDPAVRGKIPWVERNIDQRFRIYQRKHATDTVPYDESLFPRRPE